MPKFNIDFFLDMERDKELVYDSMSESDSDPAGLEARAKYGGIPIELAKKVACAENGAKGELEAFIETSYKEKLPEMKKALKAYKKSWGAIEEDFSKMIADITEHQMFNYRCQISLCFSTSDWYGTIVSKKYDDYKCSEFQRRITAFEIILSHIFHVVRREYAKDIISDSNLWGLGEVTTSFILREKNIADLLYPEFDLASITPWFKGDGISYSVLVQPEQDLQELWAARVNFENYLDKTIDFLKENPIY